MLIKQSFISNLLGHQAYKEFREWAKYIVPIGAGVFIILYLLSFFFHADIIKDLLYITNGTSLLFIGYILALIVLLDIEVGVEEAGKSYWEKEKQAPKPFKYKLTIVWAVLLFVLGIVAIYYSNRYRNRYAFECETYLVDEDAGIYHLDWDNDCKAADEAESLEVKKGYQIDKSFKFCEECKEWMEDAEDEAALVHARP